jgi:hypothetical protein
LREKFHTAPGDGFLTGGEISWKDRKDLYGEEKDAIADYIAYGKDINRKLRFPFEDPTSLLSLHQSFNRTVECLDRAILKSRTAQNHIVFRGLAGRFAEELPDIIREGSTEFEDPAFTSWSFSLETARRFASPASRSGIVMVSELKEGARALYIGGDDCEFVLLRNGVFDILRQHPAYDGNGNSITFIYVERRNVI